MTALSVNLNKLALLRNSRGHNAPDLLHYAKRFIELGVQGITIHPRPDERHITQQDAYELAHLLRGFPRVEFNIEGYPSEAFLQLVERCKPTQCTLVPDAEDQLTSDHGWDFTQHLDTLKPIIQRLKKAGVRVAVFLDPDIEQIELTAQSGTDRIELYTEEFASEFSSNKAKDVLNKYQVAAILAQKLGLGVNAGHDLNLKNLPSFLSIPDILEVSIGHALIIECIDHGIEKVVSDYLSICKGICKV
ncbi:MAG: pyridoxine 5'-phosphate synthase [Flavobacteriaceae bacterium]|uniref:Pyridoxine 5'-phosphate synthase n=1 Tax=SAR86 cluster bacterium TaxID=2030880 RepID=A0A2A5CDW0_9GAMM|nr:pyridoxine 5'-phosphate synthase [Flavobacteriaceae bacterium]MBN4053676.1 pyridoxine 5'-phosphate synthase [Haliea sp. AH-315-K21]PCJ42064.1 MAG: pyridoxine 5'-phosphate synthase [SAR86 cluster bacterium]